MTEIFIGYRWTDSEGTPGRIYDRLSDYYGAGRVFQDTEVLRAGSDVGAAIANRLAAVDVMLVVIGDGWLDVTDDQGRRRLDQPDDWVRRELELALGRPDLKVIPVLVDGALRPPRGRLPPSIARLADLKHFEVRHEHFDADVARLVTEEIGGRPRLGVWIRMHPWRVAAVALALAAVTAVAAWQLLRDPGLTPLAGQFNVAVAEFADVGDGSPSPAAELSREVAESVRAALEAGAEVTPDVGDPAEIGPIEGDSPAVREDRAAAIATEMGAQVVVYGTIDRSPGRTVFEPEFYLAGADLGGADELAGRYPLGELTTDATGSLALSEALGDFLEPKLAALGDLLVGLSRYQRKRWAEAESFFVSAADGWPTTGPLPSEANGKEVVFHLLGNVAGIQGPERLEDALQYYRLALQIDSEYARSRFGEAEVLFQLSKGPICGAPPGSTTDLDALADAASGFAAVRQLEAPEHAFLGPRAALQIGRVNLCLFNHTRDPATLEAARTAAESVIADHAGDDRVSDLVAEGHATLAGYHIIVNDPAEAIEEFRRALDATASDDHSRRAAFFASIGRLYLCDLDNPGEANAAYRQSAFESEQAEEPPKPEAVCPPTDG